MNRSFTELARRLLPADRLIAMRPSFRIILVA
jgi:hypothetical protein